MFKDENKKILYVGKAKDLKKRVSSYFWSETTKRAGRPFIAKRDLDSKTLALVAKVKSLDFIQVSSEIEAFLLEANLIKKYKPFYNIQFSDDKYYPYIEVSYGKSPFVVITRKKDDGAARARAHGVSSSFEGEHPSEAPFSKAKEDKDAFYLGPYPSSSSLKTVLKLIRKVFPFQSVKNHAKRRCLFYHLGLCPCTPVFPKRMQEYKRDLKRIERFLKGDIDKLIKDLTSEQKKYIKKEEFEKAAIIQNQIEKIKLITKEDYDPFSYETKSGFYFQRITKELHDLKNVLNENGFSIKKLSRIECYDISNIQGKNAVGSMVVFKNGDSSNKDYRRFKIYTKATPDDFLMIKEVLSRRFKHSEWDHPDLLVIDGGKGQVGSAMTVLSELRLNIPLIGLAKREEIIVIPRRGGVENFSEVKINKYLPAINILRRIRDEAHRFAITYHRLLRKKSFLPV